MEGKIKKKRVKEGAQEGERELKRERRKKKWRKKEGLSYLGYLSVNINEECDLQDTF
jgi:hypothetical protein